MDAYMEAANNYDMAPSELNLAVYNSARNIKDAQENKVTHIKNMIYDLSEANKKASFENSVLTATDYAETTQRAVEKSKGAKTPNTDIFKDKNQKLIDL